ncbi:hypothetical protein CYLTODRAFT_487607 [Cylindrobasidium torrendii FP15055 ss-10]|uniref:Wax synthase domain-containing protein n=1 Tax=Cylindrobasidium torrendii FP15055 ss-10 TaxID=1314674 RepID=A0A0D7BLE6_9AGAR|nr:hypothetical protein CYLTODRAFT_487607 [Cylindrobasidium torrendii FP15055 ss-10]
MSCKNGLLPSSLKTVPLTGETWLTLYLPPLLFYYGMAAMVTLKDTRKYRVALLPIGLVLAARVILFLDLAEGDPAMEIKNSGPTILMGAIILRIVGWALEPGQLVRTSKLEQRGDRARTTGEILWDAAELCFNQRGVGWNWGNSKQSFAPAVSRWQGAKNGLVDFVRYAPVFEAIMLLHTVRYRTNVMNEHVERIAEVFMFAGFAYAHSCAHYGLAQAFAVGVIGQDAREWTPLFDAPWKARSLTELWGRRWHKYTRDFCTRTFGELFASIFGRPGFVFGTFLISGIWHDLGTWGANRRTGICCFWTPFFVMNGVGVSMEECWYKVTGRRVGGLPGLLWLVSWNLLWGISTYEGRCMEAFLHGNETMSHLLLVTNTVRLIKPYIS